MSQVKRIGNDPEPFSRADTEHLLARIAEKNAQIKVYRDALTLAANRFRSMRCDAAAEQLEQILKETGSC